MSSFTTQTTINRHQLYRLTTKILNSHSLHFIPISLLFLPFTFFASQAAYFYLSFSNNDVEFDPFNLLIIRTIISSSQNLLTVKTVITILAFFGFVILPAIAGIALITYSTNQIIHDHKHLTFSSTVKSLNSSFIPLLHTVTSGLIILSFIFLAFSLFSIVLTEAIKVLGFHDHFFFTIFINSIFSYAYLAFTIPYFIVIWGSAPAITVLESRSGFHALKQSVNQSTEFRRSSSSIVLLTGFSCVPLLLYTSSSQKLGWTANWMMVLQVVATCLQSSLMGLMYVVANAVLYVQCKVASGEEVAVEGEVSGEYVRLDVNDKGGEVVVHEEGVSGGFNYMLYLSSIVWIVVLCVQFYHLFMMFSN